MIITVPTEDWHFDFVDNDLKFVNKSVDFTRNAVSMSLFEGGQIYAIFGFVPIWDHVAETFLFPSPKIKQKALGCIKRIKENEDYALNHFGIKRFQSSIPYGNIGLKRWADFLGYEEEGIMRYYGPNLEDHIRIAKIYD